MKKYNVDIYSVELGTCIGANKLIEAEDGNALVAKCGIAFAPNTPVTQIRISTRRVKVFLTDVNGYKFILDVMEEVDG